MRILMHGKIARFPSDWLFVNSNFQKRCDAKTQAGSYGTGPFGYWKNTFTITVILYPWSINKLVQIAKLISFLVMSPTRNSNFSIEIFMEQANLWLRKLIETKTNRYCWIRCFENCEASIKVSNFSIAIFFCKMRVWVWDIDLWNQI